MTQVVHRGPRTVWSYPFGTIDGLRWHPRYAYLCAREPVARVKMPYGDVAWLVTGYHAARTVLVDRRFSRDPNRNVPRLTPQVTLRNADPLSDMDPPDHTRLRVWLAKAFNAARVNEMRARTQATADRLVDRLIAVGPDIDLVRAFATPLALAAVTELFGVPDSHHEKVARWMDSRMPTSTLSAAKAREYNGRLQLYFAKLLRQRDAEGSVDLMGVLTSAWKDERLTGEELIPRANTLLRIAAEIAVSQLTNYVYLLQTEDDAWRLLTLRPELTTTAVEELVRFAPFTAYSAFARYASEDVELDGGLIRAGEPALVALYAANRDRRVFTDPDRLDITRDPNPHLGFGHGMHHCLGALLARMALRVGLATLAERLPGLRLLATDLRWRPGFMPWPESLPVTW